LDGNTEEDERREYTFTGGRGNSVIDYVIGDEKVRGKMNRMRIRGEGGFGSSSTWIRGKGQK